MVHDRLSQEIGRDLLFMDVDAIPLGANFATILSAEVAKCNALLAIVGPNWLNAPDQAGNRRLDHPHDFVRVEIAAALRRDIPVIPILLEGTRMPSPERLPPDLAELALRNALDVRHVSFHTDMDRLIRGLNAMARSGIAEVSAPWSDIDEIKSPAPTGRAAAVDDFRNVEGTGLAAEFEYHWSRGCVLQSRGDHGRAIMSFDLAIALGLSHPRAFLQRGFSYEKIAEYDKAFADYNNAIRCYTSIIESDPSCAHAYCGRGDSYAAKGFPDQAIGDYDRALAVDPLHEAALLGKARLSEQPAMKKLTGWFKTFFN